MKTQKHYEVRTQGDGEYDYFIEPPSDGEREDSYDAYSKTSAVRWAKKVGGWVVEVTTKLVYGRPS